MKNVGMEKKADMLKEQLKRYQQVKKIFDRHLQSVEVSKVEIVDLRPMESKLKQLELTGEDIRKMFQAVFKSKRISGGVRN
ncbi:hypothetical protein WR25_20653 [Diploscapter pachys]|uniref:Uncharacterized protein n=1 Tax=Diploscapter pachys TaxID=2018661 RepID=A0A2A2L277_9BILA|nr:hypothetical protein WR25_20653 [Diploscapter pachys]